MGFKIDNPRIKKALIFAPIIATTLWAIIYLLLVLTGSERVDNAFITILALSGLGFVVCFACMFLFILPIILIVERLKFNRLISGLLYILISLPFVVFALWPRDFEDLLPGMVQMTFLYIIPALAAVTAFIMLKKQH